MGTFETARYAVGLDRFVTSPRRAASSCFTPFCSNRPLLARAARGVVVPAINPNFDRERRRFGSCACGLGLATGRGEKHSLEIIFGLCV